MCILLWARYDIHKKGHIYKLEMGESKLFGFRRHDKMTNSIQSILVLSLSLSVFLKKTTNYEDQPILEEV